MMVMMMMMTMVMMVMMVMMQVRAAVSPWIFYPVICLSLFVGKS